MQDDEEERTGGGELQPAVWTFVCRARERMGASILRSGLADFSDLHAKVEHDVRLLEGLVSVKLDGLAAQRA